MTTIAELAEIVQDLLTRVADEWGCSTGFIKRRRKLSGASYVQSLVFGWLASPQATLEELSQSACLCGVEISRQGLYKRMTEKGAAVLKGVLMEGIKRVIRGAEQPLLGEGWSGIYLMDSTIINLPPELSGEWVGCQGSAIKISVCWELRRGGLERIALDDGRTHDRKTALVDYPLPEAALWLADLGYYGLDYLQTLGARVGWVMRYKQGTTLLDDEQQPFDLHAYLTQTEADVVDLGLYLGQTAQIPCRLVAQRLSTANAQDRHDYLRHWQSRKQLTVSQERYDLAAWDLYVTNVSSEDLPTQAVLGVSHLRWQIELLFRLWKDEVRLDEWRSANPWLILCQLYAKLLAVLIQHWVLLMGQAHALSHSLIQAARVVRKSAWLFLAALHGVASLVDVLTYLTPIIAAGGRISKSRQYTPTFQFFLDPDP